MASNYDKVQSDAFKLNQAERELLADSLIAAINQGERDRLSRAKLPTEQPVAPAAKQPIFRYQTATLRPRGITFGLIGTAFAVMVVLVCFAVGGSSCAQRTESYLSGSAVEEMVGQ